MNHLIFFSNQIRLIPRKSQGKHLMGSLSLELSGISFLEIMNGILYCYSV